MNPKESSQLEHADHQNGNNTHTVLEGLDAPSAPRTGKDIENKSKIKSLLASLDMFLSRKFGLVAVTYVTALIICATALLVVNSGGVQAGGAGNDNLNTTTINAWLFSTIAVLTFLFLLCIVYVSSRRRSKSKKATMS